MQVFDIFGEKVKGARIRVTRSDGAALLSERTGENGVLELPPGTWEDSQLHCGAFFYPVRRIAKGVPLKIPGISAGLYGELALLPLGWEEVRVSLQGQQSWNQSAVDDEKIGHRFLFLMPGTYEIADIRGQALGSAEVRAGQRTTFTISRWSGLKLIVSFVEAPEKVPAMVAIKIKGLSAGATHPTGYRILMMTGHGQWTFTEYALNPGVYEVSADESDYLFSEVMELEGGKVRPVNIRLLKR